MLTRISRFAAFAATIAVGVTLAACTQTSTPSAFGGTQLQGVNPPAGIGYIRLIGGSPIQSPATVTVDGGATSIGVTTLVYGQVTAYMPIPAGNHTVTFSSPTAAFATVSRDFTIAQFQRFAFGTVNPGSTVTVFGFQAPTFATPVGSGSFQIHTANSLVLAGNFNYSYKVTSGGSVIQQCDRSTTSCTNSSFVGTGPIVFPQGTPVNVAISTASLAGMTAFNTFTFYPNTTGPFTFPTSAGPPPGNNVEVYIIQCTVGTPAATTCNNSNIAGAIPLLAPTFKVVGFVSDPNN